MDAIICMAGSASRLNIGLNKVFYELNGQMVFLYSLNILKKYCDNIILTIREEDIDYVKPYLNERINYVIGGSERYHSVYNAMLKVKSSKVLIHDGARPFISENTIKEIREETGLEATAEKIIAIHDRNKHNVPEYVYGVCKIFVLCRVHGGEFVKNIETTGFEYFAEDEIPTLALAKNNEEQVKMCFRAYNDPNWEVEFD